MSTNLNFAMIKRTFELRTYESHGSVDNAQDLRTSLEVAGSIPGLAILFPKISDSHCDRTHSSPMGQPLFPRWQYRKAAGGLKRKLFGELVKGNSRKSMVSCTDSRHMISNVEKLYTDDELRKMNRFVNPFPKRQILEYSKLKEFADDKF